MSRILVCTFALYAACVSQTSTQVAKYPDGTVRSELETVDQRPHGVAKTYRKDGSLTSVGSYDHGRKHGLFTYYAADGTVERRELFERGAKTWSAIGEDEPAPARAATIGPAPIAPLVDNTAEPMFATLDRNSTGTHARVQLGRHTFPSLFAFDSGTVLRMEASGQVMVDAWGGYAVVTSSTLTLDHFDDSVGKSVVELGGVHVRSLVGHTLIVSAGGFGAAAGDDLEGFTAASASTPERLNDAAHSVPHTVGARTTVSLVGRRGYVLYRADLGTDALFDIAGEDDEVRMSDSFKLLGRANLAIGFANDDFAVAAELANLLSDEDRFHTAAISARWQRGRFQPYVAGFAPLKQAQRSDEFGFILGLAVTFAADAK